MVVSACRDGLMDHGFASAEKNAETDLTTLTTMTIGAFTESASKSVSLFSITCTYSSASAVFGDNGRHAGGDH